MLEPTLVFVSNAGAYPGLGAPHFGRLLIFPANIRLDYKCLKILNALAYSAGAILAKKKVFVISLASLSSLV